MSAFSRPRRTIRCWIRPKVTAGKIDTLSSPIVMQYTGIPVPAGLKIQYDSMKEIVTLVWNRPTTGSPIKGYQVLRKNAAYNVLPAAINAQIVTDTTYKDSTGVQDSSYEYYVAAVDTWSLQVFAVNRDLLGLVATPLRRFRGFGRVRAHREKTRDRRERYRKRCPETLEPMGKSVGSIEISRCCGAVSQWVFVQ